MNELRNLSSKKFHCLPGDKVICNLPTGQTNGTIQQLIYESDSCVVRLSDNTTHSVNFELISSVDEDLVDCVF